MDLITKEEQNQKVEFKAFKGEELFVNQRVENLKDPLGNDLNLYVKKGDIVIFKEVLYKHQIHGSEETIYGLVVELKEDKFNRVPYGEFVLDSTKLKFE